MLLGMNLVLQVVKIEVKNYIENQQKSTKSIARVVSAHPCRKFRDYVL